MKLSHLGKKLPEKSVEKIRLALTGRKLSKEHVQNMRIALTGKKHSEKTIDKMRKSATGRKHSVKTKQKLSKKRKIAWARGDYGSSAEWHKMVKSNTKTKETAIELKFEGLLKINNIGYKKQYPVLGKFVVDFYVPSKNLIIECDGCYWHGCPIHFPNSVKKFKKTKNKTSCLVREGYTVLNFWQHEIESKPIKCIEKVMNSRSVYT